MFILSAKQCHGLDAGTDKYFTNTILQRAGIATPGGEYFFCMTGRAHRPVGHEATTLEYFRRLGGTAFVKTCWDRAAFCARPAGCACAVVSRRSFAVLRCDIVQPIVSGNEYRVFLLDDEVLYTARKYPPFVLGDGMRRSTSRWPCITKPCSPRSFAGCGDGHASLDVVLAKGEPGDSGG
jgi:hypothetical protein